MKTGLLKISYFILLLSSFYVLFDGFAVVIAWALVLLSLFTYIINLFALKGTDKPLKVNLGVFIATLAVILFCLLKDNLYVGHYASILIQANGFLLCSTISDNPGTKKRYGICYLIFFLITSWILYRDIWMVGTGYIYGLCTIIPLFIAIIPFLKELK